MQNPVATFAKPFSTGANSQDPTTYKGNIDGDMAVIMRIGDAFAAHANSTPDMRVYLDPGHVFTGTTLTEVGADTTGTVTNASTSVAITGSTAGISGTMLVSGPGILANTTATIAGSTVTLSQAASGLASSPQTNAPLRFMQRTAAITAPGSNSRIDRVVVDRITGVVSVITGTPGASPAVPALTAGVAPIAQILLTSATTAITNSLFYDERDLAALGIPGTSQITLASATTTDLGTTKSNNVLVSGTTTITGLGSSASLDAPIYFVTFSGSLTLTHNGASLKLPGAANIKTQALDNMTALYLGSGNWQVLDYQRANGQAVSIYATETTIASATTTDIGSSNGNLVNITGTTTITGLGSSAVTANPIYKTRFTGALLLTHNGTSLIMPGAANYTTAAGDTFEWKYEGSGNWRCIGYCLASGKPLGTSSVVTVKRQVFAASGTYTPSAGMLYCDAEVLGGGGAGGAGSGGNNQASGGGAGGYAKKVISAATIGASQTITIGAGGAAIAGGAGTGTTGGTSSMGAIVSANGGTGGSNGSTQPGGLGGTASGGDINMQGYQGSWSFNSGSGISGAGANSQYGSGGQAQLVAGAGNTGSGYGAGGSGSFGNNTSGAGTGGIIVITEYCSQ